ncbi:MAG: hypothetical protein R2795_14765 [Saprospiraceae bacterium]
MEKLIHQVWWKALGVLLLIYVFTAGMLIPLKPGILTVTPGAGRTGTSVTLQIEGYNTHFKTAGDSMRCWLKLEEDKVIVAQQVVSQEEHLATATFLIPDYLPASDKACAMSIIVDNAVDGAIVRPSAIIITQDSIDPDMGRQVWKDASIDDLHRYDGMTFPFRNILYESIRNTYYHVSLWLAMMIIFIAAMVFSVRYLRNMYAPYDYWAKALTQVGLLLGILGLVTGAI